MVVGRLRTDEDEAAATFTFLASDNEEQPERSLSQNLNKKVKPMCTKDIQTHVFVWGLNDKDQLGGPKGSKVCQLQMFLPPLPRLVNLPSSELCRVSRILLFAVVDQDTDVE